MAKTMSGYFPKLLCVCAQNWTSIHTEKVAGKYHTLHGFHVYGKNQTNLSPMLAKYEMKHTST